jgi:hypothetical protein
MSQPTPPIDARQADRFLHLLGKDKSTARLRAFPHRLNPDKPKIGARSDGYDLNKASRWQREGRGVYLVINNGGDNKASITECIAFFIEWDHKPLDWQLTAWRELGLGEPTMIIATGGKSAHLYWVLDKPADPARWAPIQAALIAYCDADPACKDASRVMRLPGASYIGPAGTATGISRIVAESGRRYSIEDIEDWIQPDEFADEFAGELELGPDIDLIGPGDQPQPQRGNFPIRTMAQVREALNVIPAILPNSGERKAYRKLAWSLLLAVREAGGTDADALALLQQHSPLVTDAAEYLKTEPTEIRSNSLWGMARDHGWLPAEERSKKGSAAGPAAGSGPTQTPVTTSPEQQALPAPTTAPLLTITEVRERLAYAVEQGASRQDMEALRLELAGASDINPAALRDLLRSIEQEQEADQSIASEVATIKAEVDRQGIGRELTLDRILPPSIARALQVRCLALPVDDMAALMTYLVTVSGVVKLGTEVVASHAADYRVPLNLYGALVARSGAKKSPVSRLLVSLPTHEIRLELARQHARAMSDWDDACRGMKAADRPPEPQAAHISVSDATAEALASQLQVQEGRGLGLLLHRDELAGLFGSLNAYRSGRGGDEEQLLEAYDGSGFRSLRVAATGGGRFYERCHLSIWGTIQPPVLKALVADGDASGLWARFCFVPLPERVVPIAESETIEEQQRSQAAAAALAATCEAIYRMPRTSLELSPEARQSFVRYEQTCQGEALRASIPAQGALFGKSAGKALRIAGLLQLLQQAAPDGDQSTEITSDSMGWAILLTDQLNAWTLGLHAEVAGGGANDLMRLVHRIAMASGRAIGWRDVAVRLSKAQRREIDSAAVAKAMDALGGIGVGLAERGARGAASYTAKTELP